MSEEGSPNGTPRTSRMLSFVFSKRPAIGSLYRRPTVVRENSMCMRESCHTSPVSTLLSNLNSPETSMSLTSAGTFWPITK